MTISFPNIPKTRALIITHDVDWQLHGPGTSHVLARQNRFPPDIVRKVVEEGFNPYYGIPKVMEIEEKYNIRSTFFFRPKYDDGTEVDQYEKTIKIFYHTNGKLAYTPIIHNTPRSGPRKGQLERVAGQRVYGSRVHYLKVTENTFTNLAQSGIKYDSSLSFNKEQIDPRNTGYIAKNGLVVFPVTFMDAYLFTYLHLTEETIVPFMVKTIMKLFTSGTQIMTLLWHDNSVMMKGGRAYSELIKQLSANQI